MDGIPVYLYSKQKLGSFFGPFGPFGPFLHIGIFRQIFNVTGDQTDQMDQPDRKKIEHVPKFCLLLSRRGIPLVLPVELLVLVLQRVLAVLRPARGPVLQVGRNVAVIFGFFW